MSSLCCIEDCKKGPGEDVTLFKFPTSRTHRRRWLAALPGQARPAAGAVICSHHFHRADYEAVRGKLRLKRKVVPCLFGDQHNTDSAKSPKGPDKTTDSKEPNVSVPVTQQNEEVPNITEDGEEGSTPEIGRVMADPTDCTSESFEENCIEVTPQIPEESPPPTPEMDTNKQDIEDILTSYHLKNTPGEKQIHPIAEDPVRADPVDVRADPVVKRSAVKADPVVVRADPVVNRSTVKADPVGVRKDRVVRRSARSAVRADPVGVGADPVRVGADPGSVSADPDTVMVVSDKGEDSDIEFEPPPKPVFIEISVDKASGPGVGLGVGVGVGNSQDDCLMVLENVQVDIDPGELMLPERDDEDLPDDDKKGDPISLLTSSDEDDVILEEPHIDTVEVSDETDEDDVPLVKLLHKPETPDTPDKPRPDIAKMFWGMYEYYCMECHYTTTSRADYKNHVKEHATVIQICQICGYTTASKAQFARHKRKHKDDRKWKCHLCDYRAKHNMSLIYHLKSHDKANLSSCKKGFKCKKCGFRSDVKSAVLKHVRMCSMDVKKYPCGLCQYETKRPSDLKRHVARRHAGQDQDKDYEPGMT